MDERIAFAVQYKHIDRAFAGDIYAYMVFNTNKPQKENIHTQPMINWYENSN